MDIALQLALLPESAGVYQYYDAAGQLLYVGKAINLKKRVSSYFSKREDRDSKTIALVEKITNISTIVTTNETEALLLEDSLIKKHQPPYNIDLKDNKHYPYFRLSLQEEYPRLTIVRQRSRDGASYFGPYPGSIREALKTINQVFKLCKCKKPMQKKCLYQQLGQCLAPCQGDREELYQIEVKKVIAFLRGGYEEVITTLQQEMNTHANNMQYEAAATVRDKIQAIERIANKQTVIAPDKIRRDIWYFTNNESIAVGTVIVMEFGRIIAVQHYYGSCVSALDEDYPKRFIVSYYLEHDKPTETITPEDYKSGFRYELIQIARRNCLKALQERMLENLRDHSPVKGLQRLQNIVSLEKLPERIDCFDISHIQGSETVASMSVFRNGLPDKS